MMRINPDYQRAIGRITVRNILYSYGNTLDLPANQSNGIKRGNVEMKKSVDSDP